jgi:hypothetical protein
MRTRPGPCFIQELARAIARWPGRAEVDEQEANRITDDMAEWYLRGEFADSDVVALVGNPPIFRSLAEIKEDAQRRGENWCLSQPEWRAVYWLTAPAARRYLEACGYTGAWRVLREWFGWAEGRGKPGPKPKQRNAIADRMFDDLQSRRRTPDELKGDKLAVLVAQYDGGSANTANAARTEALARFTEFLKSNSEEF